MSFLLFQAAILTALESYARSFSQQIGYPFHEGSIRNTALTGAAATEIGGDTTCREFQLKSKKTRATEQDLNYYCDMRMAIVDEVSFMSHSELIKLSENLQRFTECREFRFGKMPIVFLGDFRQLENINGKGILDFPNSIYWEQAINCMIELKGVHRFRECEKMKDIMPAMHSQGLSEEHRRLLNSRVIGGKDINGNIVKMPNIASTRFATYHNKNRCSQNSQVFREYLKEFHSKTNSSNIPKSAIVVKSNPSWGKTGHPFSYMHRKILFENCTDADIVDANRKRCDPFLTLWYGCHLMVNANSDVKHGIANGTTGYFRKIVFKSGKEPSPIRVYGYWIYCISITDVDHIVLKWTEDSKFQGFLKIYPQKGTFRVNFPISEGGHKFRIKPKVEMNFLSVLLNHATTGHKLQGKSLDELVIAEWSKVKNWAYVAISRVRTLAGLFLFSPIPRDINFTPCASYLNMMQNLRTRVLATANDISDLMQNYFATR